MAVTTPEGLRPLDDQMSMAAEQRQKRQAEALRAVQAISQMAGKSLVIESVTDPHAIPPEPGVYVFGNHLAGDTQVSDVNFDLKKRRLSGAADSAHSVLAGDLRVDYRGRGTENHNVKVAAKCFAKRTPEERFTRAIREVIIMEDLEGCGRLSLEPIALAVAPDRGPTKGEIMLLTRYEEDLLTLDNMPWKRGPADQRNLESARLAMRTLGDFNARLGYRHNDAKIKNCAVQYGHGAGMIDYETSEEFDRTNPFEASVTAEVDYWTMLDSLIKKGFLSLTRIDPRGNRVAEKPEVMEAAMLALDHLASDYLSAWSDSPADVQDIVTSQVLGVTEKCIESQLGTIS